MSLFDRLVWQAMQAKPELTAVKAVVEKELLHHDILREMSAAGLLAGLTFIGGMRRSSAAAKHTSVRCSLPLAWSRMSRFLANAFRSRI
ncbi:MAG: hypothetical protein ABSD29_06775 [Verrucomicrobiota bacterium]